MATIDSKETIERMIKDHGETYCHPSEEEMAEGERPEPPVMRITQYINAWGGTCWGVVWADDAEDIYRYNRTSEYIRSPVLIWEREDLMKAHPQYRDVTIAFDIDRVKALRKAYETAVSTGRSDFVFESYELDCGYAKYLLEYLESKFNH